MPDTKVIIIKGDHIPDAIWEMPPGTRFIWIPSVAYRRKFSWGPALYTVGGKTIIGSVHDAMLPMFPRTSHG